MTPVFSAPAVVLPSVLGPGYEIGYDFITGNVNITGTSEGSPTTIIAGSAHTFDGGAVMAEVFGHILTPNGPGPTATLLLMEGATEITRFVFFNPNVSSGNTQDVLPCPGAYRFSPSAGSHTYSLAAFVGSTAGTPAVWAGTGGAAAYPPAFLRFTKV